MANSLLITGMTGFIGSLLARRLYNDPAYDRIVCFSRDWHKQEDLRNELGNNPKFRWFIGDILDKQRLLRAMNGIDFVLHTASNKSIVDNFYSPREAALLNNCIGTQNVVDAAIDSGVKKVLFISSDKSVASSSAYGASKCLGEYLVIAGNSYSPHGTRLSASRYGNVLKSSGSCALVFEKQRVGGVITITDPTMTRFWITANDACVFVLKCLDEMLGGEVFVPKLPASLVIDLAKAIAPDARVEIIGIRPSEKIHELMLSDAESWRTKELDWNAYRIEPAIKFWESAVGYPGGSPVPQGWSYSSASATRLTVEQLRAML